ncbi:AMP-binding protein [Nocardioidaceae bacterium]|nr:AMP-binding protein [Nocardioidaceae bacterium]
MTASSHHRAPLTPTAFLDRAAEAFADRVAVVDGGQRWTYAELRDRAARLAGGLAALPSVEEGRPVAVLAPNSHVLLEAHYGVPWSGVPLVALNTRLGRREMSYILGHCRAGVLIRDASFAGLVEESVAELEDPPRVIDAGEAYEALLADAEPVTGSDDLDEEGVLSINYTSGTTGSPKGVMYQHRGAYLQALAMVGHFALSPRSVHLWTLPMFHCNGWCFPWAVTAAGGTHVCLPAVDPTEVWRLLRAEGVTHLEGAPTVLSMIAHAEEASPLDRPVSIATGGAPPSPAILRRMAELGFDVTHLYGLTETYGPALVCEWLPEWDGADDREVARLKSRQGIGNMVSLRPRVVADDGTDVPADGETMGEIAMAGNNVMLGYLDDEEATAAAVPDGWFRTGDVGVMHPDGYLELRDRSKDVIVSGGENIASVEVEHVIADLDGVIEVAVVGSPHEKWGEVPVAYVALEPGAEVTEQQVIEHVRAEIAHFKAPHQVVFGDLPKTSTGKTQKYVLRERADDSPH